MTSKMLVDMSASMENVAMSKAAMANLSYFDIEKEKYRINKLSSLPPIERISALNKGKISISGSKRTLDQ